MNNQIYIIFKRLNKQYLKKNKSKNKKYSSNQY